MLRAIRRILLLLCVAAISGGLLLTFTTKPDLESADTAVQRAFATVRPQIDQRAKALEALNAAMIKAGRKVDLADEASSTIRSWRARDSSFNDRIVTANRLSTIGVRMLAIASDSPRFASNDSVIAAANRYQQQLIDPDDRERLNLEVDRANAIRDGLLRRLVADALGYADLPQLIA